MSYKIKKTLSIVLFFLANFAFSQEIPVVENQTFEYQDNIVAYSIPPKMQWWYEARFGMFIHFGSYSHYGHGEWEMFLNKWSKEDYQNKITKKFNPKHFNAKEIVSLAKQAGMKYIIITAKHHEGFCMWNTQVDDFKDYTNTTTFDLYHYLGFERDLLMELKNECDKQGLKFGLYYSILDWSHHSQFAKDYWSQLYSMDEKAPFIEAEKRQIKELIDRYHPAVLWFDGDWCDNKDTADVFNWWTKQDAVDLYNYIMSIDSSIIVNERIKRNLGLGDFMCPEEKIPSKPLARPWETCRTMNGAWGYDKSKSSPKNYLTADQIFEELFMTAS
nr:alpha-L-fucosidase [Bacteroidales bacterium]